ncbi:DNA-binding protein [Kaistia defluvii]|uniref:DNA-binding protein n=1 Tax=Kaistia defluvii TaxID=410841 RepID=A0ABV2R151_9HYPH
MTGTDTSTPAITLIWGADSISKVIGRSPRSTFNMLERGELPAKKVGRRWVAEHGALVRFFMETAA